MNGQYRQCFSYGKNGIYIRIILLLLTVLSKFQKYVKMYTIFHLCPKDFVQNLLKNVSITGNGHMVNMRYSWSVASHICVIKLL